MSLFSAVVRRDGTTVAKLLSRDPSLLSDALDIAMTAEDAGSVSLLITHSPKYEAPSQRALLWAAGKGRCDLVAQILAKYPSLIHHERPFSVMDEAITRDQVGIVAQLLTLEPTLLTQAASWIYAARNGRDRVLNLVLSHDSHFGGCQV